MQIFRLDFFGLRFILISTQSKRVLVCAFDRVPDKFTKESRSAEEWLTDRFTTKSSLNALRKRKRAQEASSFLIRPKKSPNRAR
jgi:hypothetical protein